MGWILQPETPSARGLHEFSGETFGAKGLHRRPRPATLQPMLTPDDLRIRRITLRIKLKTLASRLRVHESTVSRWETGALQPTKEQLAKWDVALGKMEAKNR